MSKKSFIDSVEVKSPCTEDWEKMHGNDRIRFCDHCAKDVNNISEMTRKQAMRLVRASGGNLCIRYMQDPRTKRPLFAEQLLQITRRTPGLAAGVMTASISLSTLSYAQGDASSITVHEPVKQCPDKAVIPENAPAIPVATPETEAAKEPVRAVKARGSLTGILKDYNGGVIPGMTVTITDVVSGASQSVTSSEDGFFEFASVDAAEIDLLIPAQKGFMSKNIRGMQIGDRATPLGDMVLDVAAMGGVMVSIEYAKPLQRAVADENVELVRELIAQGENVNGKDENYDKITPLFVAVEHGNIEIVQLLLDAGAKVNARNGEKQTPLMRLDDDATLELVELLLRHGAKLNATDNDNNTALIYVAERVKPEILKALIDAGADVNVVNKEGQTALMNAASDDSLEKVRMLLEAGARANAKNDSDENAWDLASDTDVRELLAMYGADTKVETEQSVDAKDESVPAQEPVPDDH